MLTSASLPDFAEPGVLGVGAVVGAMVGRTIAWALGYDADNRMQWSVDGSYWGSGIAFVAYLIGNLLEGGFS